MHLVHTIGCSFTKWIYPTWSDYIAKHYDAEVRNLGFSGTGNSIIKKKLYTIEKSDHVFIMFSGRDRQVQGIDKDCINENINNYEINTSILHSIKSDTQHWFLNSIPLSAFVNKKSVTKGVTSKFHDHYQMLEDIYDCQNYLQAKGIDYNFSLWQGFYNDLSKKRNFLLQRHMNHDDYMKNSIYHTIFTSIDHDQFFQNIKKGLWEYMLDHKDLVEVQSTVDMHPSTLCHFDYFKTYIKPVLDKKIPCKDNMDHLYSQAKKFSQYFRDNWTEKSTHDYDERTREKYFELFENL